MRYLKLIIFFLIITACRTTYAESYIVDAPVLNVRSCAGTNCQIIRKLTKGDTIVSIKDDGKWVEIKTENGSGYVIKKALSEDNTLIYMENYMIFFVMLFFVIWFVFFNYMLPAKIASDNKNFIKIYKVNLFLGWIPVIWLILLLAALIGESNEDKTL